MTDTELKLPAIDPVSLEEHTGTYYPDAVKGPAEARIKRRLGDALGLSHFGVNYTILPPGTWSAFRHWHQNEDEFVYILEGEVTLISDAGEQILGPGMAAGFPAGDADGHQLINNSSENVVMLEVGNRTPNDTVQYPDMDLMLVKKPGDHQYSDRQGNPIGDKVAGAPGSDDG
ncbi:MAG: cupin domain-containing protein [Rhodospirillaceae bacterium]|jgi:uncharacterized cupin superfamily protein|nr:cupin domain-containing protein [Rhodospirillaceae bacterium]MBT4937990.1 cupin domain-containing protein [Rhodospirillaceae bacterium]MBT5938353.1 cupin domain-containing protein [Rhodospirillaceae bacterium]MBT7268259.1 cupin domain-containing protein [Rhodospirillaceae bacterium]